MNWNLTHPFGVTLLLEVGVSEKIFIFSDKASSKKCATNITYIFDVNTKWVTKKVTWIWNYKWFWVLGFP